MSEWIVTLYTGRIIVDAKDENEARSEALQAIAESLDLLKVERVSESDA